MVDRRPWARKPGPRYLCRVSSAPPSGALVSGPITLADSALLTDLYELTMAAAFSAEGIGGRATFSLFTRRLPPGRGFLVAAGL